MKINKAGYFFILFVLICLFAGIYGVIHDQISYTVSSEYFTKFKFIQFNIPNNIRNRIGVSIIGWSATWWMGILIGIFLIPIGLVIPKPNRYFISMLKVFLIVIITALITGLLGLLIGYLKFSPDNLPNFWYPKNIENKVQFAIVGQMHNFSYIGGLLGIISGIISIFIFRKIEKKKMNRFLFGKI